MARLAGKIPVIIGGTTGIRHESARLFRDEGATVIATGASPDNVAAAGRDLGVEAFRCDVLELGNGDAIMADLKARHGRLDVVFAMPAAARNGRSRRLTAPLLTICSRSMCAASISPCRRRCRRLARALR